MKGLLYISWTSFACMAGSYLCRWRVSGRRLWRRRCWQAGGWLRRSRGCLWSGSSCKEISKLRSETNSQKIFLPDVMLHLSLCTCLSSHCRQCHPNIYLLAAMYPVILAWVASGKDGIPPDAGASVLSLASHLDLRFLLVSGAPAAVEGGGGRSLAGSCEAASRPL